MSLLRPLVRRNTHTHTHTTTRFSAVRSDIIRKVPLAASPFCDVHNWLFSVSHRDYGRIRKNGISGCRAVEVVTVLYCAAIFKSCQDSAKGNLRRSVTIEANSRYWLIKSHYLISELIQNAGQQVFCAATSPPRLYLSRLC